MQGIGLLWFGSVAAVGVVYSELVLPLIVAGIGVSMALPIVPTVVVSSVKPHEMGKASGVNSTLQRFGAAFAIAVGAAVFAANGHIGTEASFQAGFRPALMVVASGSVIGCFVSLAIRSGGVVPVALDAPAVVEAA